MPRAYDELLHRAQFTKLMVNIQDDIKKLTKTFRGEQREERFSNAMARYLNSARRLNDYLNFRTQALDARDYYLRELLGPSGSPSTKQIVYNIALGILGLGVIYGLAVGMNYLLTGNTLFFKPEAVSRVETVFNDVDALKHNAFAVIV